MGTFSVTIKMRNFLNSYVPESERGEDVECEALVDTGAAQLALPAEIVEKLALRPLDTINAYTADGGRHKYRICGIVELEVQGRTCQVRAVELPRGTRPLLGALPLEELDWHVSPLGNKLVPNPESPDGPLLPLCSIGRTISDEDNGDSNHLFPWLRGAFRLPRKTGNAPQRHRGHRDAPLGVLDVSVVI